MEQHPDEGYDGAAEVLVDAADGADAASRAELAIEVTLRGGFQPIDGRYHWYGRLARDEALDEVAGGGTTVTLRTPHGQAEGRLSDVDPWGRYRISGTGRPPFPVA